MIIDKNTTDSMVRDAVSKEERITTLLTEEDLHNQFGGFAMAISSEIESDKNVIALIYGTPVYAK